MCQSLARDIRLADRVVFDNDVRDIAAATIAADCSSRRLGGTVRDAPRTKGRQSRYRVITLALIGLGVDGVICHDVWMWARALSVLKVFRCVCGEYVRIAAIGGLQIVPETPPSSASMPPSTMPILVSRS
jgi:hypothetical protein